MGGSHFISSIAHRRHKQTQAPSLNYLPRLSRENRWATSARKFRHIYLSPPAAPGNSWWALQPGRANCPCSCRTDTAPQPGNSHSPYPHPLELELIMSSKLKTKTKAQLLQVNNKVKGGEDRTSTQGKVRRCSGSLLQPSLPCIHCSLCQKRIALPTSARIPPLTASYPYPLIQILGLTMFSIISTISMRRKRPTAHAFLPSDELFRNLQ